MDPEESASEMEGVEGTVGFESFDRGDCDSGGVKGFLTGGQKARERLHSGVRLVDRS